MTLRLERDGEACKITSTYVFCVFIIADIALFSVMDSALSDARMKSIGCDVSTHHDETTPECPLHDLIPN